MLRVVALLVVVAGLWTPCPTAAGATDVAGRLPVMVAGPAQTATVRAIAPEGRFELIGGVR